MRTITQIIVHCAATPNGKHFTTADINRWHRERGFKRSPEWMARQNKDLDAIGYHFAIYVNGAVATGRHLEEVGAHAQNFNQKSIGVCLIGTDAFTPAQWESLRANISGLQKQFPGVKVVGHRDLPDVHKSCPGFDVTAWLAADMAPLAGHVLEIKP